MFPEQTIELIAHDAGKKIHNLYSDINRPVKKKIMPHQLASWLSIEMSKIIDYMPDDNCIAQVLAISQQDVDHHQKFSSKHNFKFPLLADTKKVVLAAYGVLGFLNLPRRSVFVISPNGIVSYLHRAVVGVSYRPVAELVEAIADAQAGTH